MKGPVYSVLSDTLQARLNCVKSGNGEWFRKATDVLNAVVDIYLPRGSGIDNGTKLDFDASTPERLVFIVDFHHMNENGFYDGWTHHRVIVTASLLHGINLKISGPDRNDVKEYLHQTYGCALQEEIEV